MGKNKSKYSSHPSPKDRALAGQNLAPKNPVPIIQYLDTLEEGAQEQAEWCAKLPHAFHHIALMPDAHQGYAMPVGGVMALDGAVMPNAVGVDIGCGMIAARTPLTACDIRKDLESIAYEVLNRIPVGFEHHKKPQKGRVTEYTFAKGGKKVSLKEQMPVMMEYAEEIPYQLGTLGGGNHFIEFQRDTEDTLWVMLHSGSRNIGLKIANAYHRIAKQYCASLGFPGDYAFLPLDVPEADLYLNEMQWAMDFAAENRAQMMDTVLSILTEFRGRAVRPTFHVQTHHNYAAWETHFGQDVLVHRKGAVFAGEGVHVIIPGSMGTASYIGVGKGAEASFRSCSHGAGRQLGRKQAMKAISVHEFERQLEGIIVVTPKLNRILDEAPSAYKNIDQVMENQKDLVEIAYRLEPLAVVKG
ncbi:MAG: RtcB family protein [bacterium]|jgi:tRNA-splicing ligase RtcB|nr:RtcB family protein [bacterium]